MEKADILDKLSDFNSECYALEKNLLTCKKVFKRRIGLVGTMFDKQSTRLMPPRLVEDTHLHLL